MPDIVERLCPMVLRPGPEGLELLDFRHSLVGVRLVEDTREPGETVVTGSISIALILQSRHT